MGYTCYLTFRGLLGLESSYRSRSKEGFCGGWGEVLRKINSVLHITVSKEANMLFSGNAELIPSEGGIEATGYYQWVGEVVVSHFY